MGKLTAREVAALAHTVGLRGENTIATAVAVATAESGRRTEAHNPRGCDDSYGLWQINMVEGRSGCDNLGPSRRQQYGLRSNEDLWDPMTNAQAMAAISSNGSNWNPWSVYTNGTYRIHLGTGRSAANAIENAGTKTILDLVRSARNKATVKVPDKNGGIGLDDLIPNPVSDVAKLLSTPITLIADALNAYLSYLRASAEWISNRENWIRVMQVLLGGSLIIVGTSLILRPVVENRATQIVGQVKRAAA